MNKKGFTLIELLAVIVIISIILMIIYPSITKTSEENKEKLYQGYEKMMIEYAMVSSKRNQSIIKLNDLEELDKVKKECKGYVEINHDVTPNTYKAYIKCDDKYQTKGFIESKA